jgi:hypothetical protein
MNSKYAKLTSFGVFLTTVFLLAGCRAGAESTTKSVTGTGANSTVTDSPTQITITVEGPWAYTTNDKSHPGKLVLVAPKDTKGHKDPEIHYFLGWLPATGDPEITFQNYVSPEQSKCDTGAQLAPLKQASFNRAIANTKNRFVIVLPLPDSCTDYETSISKISQVWWTQTPPTAQDSPFPTMIELTYTVSPKGQFSADGGKHYYDFLGGHEIQIQMEPTGKIKPDDCDSGSRHAFHMLVKLFNDVDPSFTYYEDFPPYDSKCWNKDEQRPKHAPKGKGSGIRSLDGSGSCRKAIVRLNLGN